MQDKPLEAMTRDVIDAYAAIEARVARGEPHGFGNEAFAALTKLLGAIGLDRTSHPAPLEEATLSDTQRATLVSLVEHRVELRGATSLSLSWWRQRRWLGGPREGFEGHREGFEEGREGFEGPCEEFEGPREGSGSHVPGFEGHRDGSGPLAPRALRRRPLRAHDAVHVIAHEGRAAGGQAR
ncbi:MAG: hypothetical protein K1X94_12105 [Sandaracinaceae bacterium]|nr:hypothetical protein [Sandaracinaceae bacterium]